jgi:hypothetical protein
LIRRLRAYEVLRHGAYSIRIALQRPSLKLVNSDPGRSVSDHV